MRYGRWQHVADFYHLQAKGINPSYRTTTDIDVCINAPIQSNRIRLHIPPRRRVVVPEVVVVRACLLVIVLPRKPQVVCKDAKSQRIVVRQIRPKRITVAPLPHLAVIRGLGKGFIGFLYKIIRGINLKRKVKVLNKHKSGKEVLDIGCGIGFFPKAANKKGYHTRGIEPDPDALKFAVENNKIEAYSLEKLNGFSREFDTVTMWHVLEHVYHLREQLSIIKIFPENSVTHLFLASAPSPR